MNRIIMTVTMSVFLMSCGSASDSSPADAASPIIAKAAVSSVASPATETTSTVGPAGPAGPQGEKGEKGDKGDTGSSGQDGINGVGIQGIAGAAGQNGTNGTNGSNGLNGTNGVDGQDGTVLTMLWYPDLINNMANPVNLGVVLGYDSVNMNLFTIKAMNGANPYVYRLAPGVAANTLRVAKSSLSTFVWYMGVGCTGASLVQERPKYRSEVFGSAVGTSNRCWMTTINTVSAYTALSKWDLTTGTCIGSGGTVNGWLTTACPAIAEGQIVTGSDKAISMFEIVE